MTDMDNENNNSNILTRHKAFGRIYHVHCDWIRNAVAIAYLNRLQNNLQNITTFARVYVPKNLPLNELPRKLTL